MKVTCAHASCSVGRHTKKNATLRSMRKHLKKDILQYGKKVLRDKQRQCNRGDKDACEELPEIRRLLKQIKGRQ